MGHPVSLNGGCRCACPPPFCSPARSSRPRSPRTRRRRTGPASAARGRAGSPRGTPGAGVLERRHEGGPRVEDAGARARPLVPGRLGRQRLPDHRGERLRRVAPQGGPLRRHRARADRARAPLRRLPDRQADGEGPLGAHRPRGRAPPGPPPQVDAREPDPRHGREEDRRLLRLRGSLRLRRRRPAPLEEGPRGPRRRVLRGARRAVGRRQLAGHPRGRRVPAVRRPQRPVPRRLRSRHRKGALAHAAKGRAHLEHAPRPRVGRANGRSW